MTEKNALHETQGIRIDIRIICIVIFAVAFGVRLAHVLSSQENPFMSVPIVDMSETWKAAEQVAKGTVSYESVFWKPPLYTYFVAFVRLFTGSSILGFLVVQSVLGAINCLLLYFLARKYLREIPSLIAALAMSLYGPFVLFDSMVLSVTLSTFLNICLLLSLHWSMEKNKKLAYLVPGLLAGLSAITHQLVLVFAVCVLFLVWFGDRKAERRIRVRRIALFAIGCIVAIAPVTLHNLVIGKKLVPISHNAGINFYAGNREGYNGMDQPPLGIAWSKIQGEAIRALDLDFGNPDAEKVSSYLFAKGLGFAVSKPIDFTVTFFKKLLFLSTGTELKNNVNPYLYTDYSPVLAPLLWATPFFAFPFGLLFPLAMLGMIIAIVRKTDFRMLIAYIASISFGIALFFVSDRFRMFLVPVLLVLAAYAVQTLMDAIREKKPGRLSIYSLFIPLLVVANIANATVFENNRKQEHYDYYQLGKEYFYRNDYKNSLVCLDNSIAVKNANPDAYLIAGYVFASTARYEEALGYADKALAFEPAYQAANLLKAQIFLQQSRKDDARRELYRIVNNKQYWNDYTPMYAREMLADLETVTPSNP